MATGRLRTRRRMPPLRLSLLAATAPVLAAACGDRTALLIGPAAAAADAGPDAAPVPPGLANRILLFGGRSERAPLADTWVWDGRAWTQRTPATHPGPRFSASASSDNGKVVLFGGVAVVGGGGVDQGDTWTCDGSNWVAVTAPQSPSARDNAMTAWDGRSTFLFGGYQTGRIFGDTWTWNGHTWAEANPAGALPSSRSAGAVATLGQSAVLFGGRDGATNLNVADTWTFDGASWVALLVNGPSPRLGHAMATQGNTLVLFGGFENTDTGSFPLGDTWVWDGTAWTQHTVTGPSARSSHSMASLGDKAVMYGGVDAHGQLLDETWIWDGVSWTLVAGRGPGARSDAAMAAFRE